MSLLQVIKAKNGTILCKKVKYGEGIAYDPNDTSNVWFEVLVSSDEKEFKKNIDVGDLVRYPPRLIVEEVIEGEKYYSFQKDNVSLIIKSEDVKKSLFK